MSQTMFLHTGATVRSISPVGIAQQRAAQSCRWRVAPRAGASQSEQGAEAGSTRRKGLSPMLASTLLLGGSTLSAGSALAEASPTFDLAATSLTDVFISLQSMDNAEPLMLLLATAVGMIPLVPTQPTAIACGLLFGVERGFPVALAATTMAALGAFTAARLAGTKLVGAMAGGGAPTGEGPEGQAGGLDVQINKMKSLVEEGDSKQQFVKVLLLRLTPVFPYSLSNYVMGLTEVPTAPFAAGTAAGMAPWMLFYTFVGGTGRNLLQGGGDFSTVLSDLVDQAGGMLEGPLRVLVGVTAVGLLAFALVKRQEAGKEEA